MRAFRSLTPTGRLRRVRTVAAEALREYALPEPRFRLLADSFNTVYRVSARGETFLLRVGPERRIHQLGAATAEREWLDHLAGCGLPVPRIIPAKDGAASVVVAVPDVPRHRECTLLSWTTGRTVTRPVRSDDVAELAVLSARLHDASPPVATRPAGVLDGRSVLHFEVPNLLDQVTEPHRTTVRAAHERAQRGLSRLWRTASDAPRLIHSDLTPRNVLRSRGRLAAIDFQDMTWGHLEQDLANTLFAITRGVDVNHALATFRTSYERVRPWPGPSPDQLEDLIAARRIEMINLALVLDREGLHDYIARHAAALCVHKRALWATGSRGSDP